MRNTNSEKDGWHFSRQINLAVLIQLLLLASLIVGSWVNLQRQLDLLRYDVSLLLQRQRQLHCRLEELAAAGINHEYRLRAVEKAIAQADGPS